MKRFAIIVFLIIALGVLLLFLGRSGSSSIWDVKWMWTVYDELISLINSILF